MPLVDWDCVQCNRDAASVQQAGILSPKSLRRGEELVGTSRSAIRPDGDPARINELCPKWPLEWRHHWLHKQARPFRGADYRCAVYHVAGDRKRFKVDGGSHIDEPSAQGRGVLGVARDEEN